MRVRRQNLWRHLLERRDVVQNPKAATVGCKRQVMKPLLYGDPIDRSVRKSTLQRLPVLAIVKRNVQTILCSQVELRLARRVFANAMDVTQHAVRNAIRYLRPRSSVIYGLIRKRIPIVQL